VTTSTKAAPPLKLAQIDTLAGRYADARAALAGTVSGLNDEIEEVKRKYIGRIKVQVARAKDCASSLQAAIEEAPEHFTKPRTITMHGIKVGFRKGEGKLSFDDVDKVVALIEKHLPELAETLIVSTKKPVKDALLNLSVEQLKKIGCKVTGTGDQVVIKDTTSDVDKLVAALLAEDEEVEA
jgi:hypothetical protein